MKRKPKLRALIKADAQNNVGALGALLDILDAPRGQPIGLLANRPLNSAFGQHLFREEYAACNARELFESLLSHLPQENADDLRKLFLLAYFEGVAGAGREVTLDGQTFIQKEIGRRGGKKAGRKRADDAKTWRDEALPIAQEYQKQHPGHGRTYIAKEIDKRLRNRVRDLPEFDHLKKVVGEWQASGLLQRARKQLSGVVNPLRTPSK
jgi:hypothetical protein